MSEHAAVFNVVECGHADSGSLLSGMTERDSSSAHAMPSVHAMHMHSGVDSMSTMAQSDTDAGTECCSDQPDYLPAFSLILGLRWGGALPQFGTQGKYVPKSSSFFFEPPLYNFPRVHLLHCSLLN